MINNAVLCWALVGSLALPALVHGEDAQPTSLLHTAQVTSFAGAEQKRLSCYRGTEQPFCNLRIYEIMVEAFMDGDGSANYGTGYGTSHHRGDLQGIIDALDYIKSLGVNSVWLTPIFETRAIKRQNEWSNRLDATGYYTTNFFQIDPKFGTDQQFQTLVSEVHKRDMYIFLDGSFGHYKKNIVASPSGALPLNREKCVAGTPDMDTWPDWNTHQACADYSAEATRDFFNEVIGYWIQNYKIDGWRLDQAYQIPLDQWREYRATAERVAANTSYKNSQGKLVRPLGYMVAEILWRRELLYNSKAYGSTEQPALGSAFEFFLRDHLVATLAMDEASEKVNQPATWLAAGFEQFDSYPDHAQPNLVIGNHDLVRFGDLIQRAGLGNPTEQRYWDRHKAVLTFWAAFSGPITLYYGEETGQELPGFAAKEIHNCSENGVCDDHVARTNGKIDDLNERQIDLKNYVARLMALRAKNPALTIGSRTHVYSDQAIYVDLKKAGKNQVLLILNTKDQPATLTLKKSLFGNPQRLNDLLGKTVYKPSGDEFVIELPALASRVLAF